MRVEAYINLFLVCILSYIYIHFLLQDLTGVYILNGNLCQTVELLNKMQQMHFCKHRI